MTTMGTLILADRGIRVLRQIYSKSRSAAFGDLSGHLHTIPSFIYFIVSVQRMNESV